MKQFLEDNFKRYLDRRCIAMLKKLKIALLIVILAEEIRSATNKPTYKVNVDTDELIKKLKPFE